MLNLCLTVNMETNNSWHTYTFGRACMTEWLSYKRNIFRENVWWKPLTSERESWPLHAWFPKHLTHKEPPNFCSRQQFQILLLFQKTTNKAWYFMRIICQQTILMKYHTLFFSKIKKVVKLSSAAVVIGALTLYSIIRTFDAFEISCIGKHCSIRKFQNLT